MQGGPVRTARFGSVVSAMTIVLAMAAPAAAQDIPDGLAGILLRFFAPNRPVVVLQAAPDPFSHAAHFVSQPAAQQILTQLNGGIASQLSTFPLGSSSAGFTYTFDPALGVFNRSTETFGPVFAERPVTAGKGKFSFGVNYQKAKYDRFEGRDLRERDIQIFLVHQDVNNDQNNLFPWFEGDLIRADLSVDLQNETTVFFANYGLSDRFDIGVAIPYQRLDLTAQVFASVERVSTTLQPTIHRFDDGTDSRVYSQSDSASGIGDVVVRAKYNLVRRPSASVAAAVDVRLPTGNEDDLLGSGGNQTKLFLIAAGPAKRFSPRGSLGYTFSGGGAAFLGDLPNEVNYTAGFDAGVHRRVTLTADLLGRYLIDANRLVDQEQTLRFRTNPAGNDPTTFTTTRTSAVVETGNLNLLLGSAGLRVNLVGRLLLVGNVLFALNDNGLQDKVIPVFGVDYSF
jgi:hypothetical protein